MPRGFLFRIVLLDWYSRSVVAWTVSNTQDPAFCLEALEQAFTHGCPEIFNSDQGCQFTSTAFTARLEAAGVQISMDGRGRVVDNIFIERLWRTVKYEYWYLAEHRNSLEGERGLTRYFRFYNTERPHQALGYYTPEHVHFGKAPTAYLIRRSHDSRLTYFSAFVVLTMGSTLLFARAILENSAWPVLKRRAASRVELSVSTQPYTNQEVGIGIPIARHFLHRSQQASFTHWALDSGDHAKLSQGIEIISFLISRSHPK